MGARWPQLRLQLLAGDDVAGPPGQKKERAKRLLLQRHAPAGPAQLPFAGIELENAKAQDGPAVHGGDGATAAGPAARSPDQPLVGRSTHALDSLAQFIHGAGSLAWSRGAV